MENRLILIINTKQIYNGNIVIGRTLEFVYEGQLFNMLEYGIDIERIRNSETIKRGFKIIII